VEIRGKVNTVILDPWLLPLQGTRLFPVALLGEYSEIPGLVRKTHDGFMFLVSLGKTGFIIPLPLVKIQSRLF
jgi:hypothetical protein